MWTIWSLDIDVLDLNFVSDAKKAIRYEGNNHFVVMEIILSCRPVWLCCWGWLKRHLGDMLTFLCFECNVCHPHWIKEKTTLILVQQGWYLLWKCTFMLQKLKAHWFHFAQKTDKFYNNQPLNHHHLCILAINYHHLNMISQLLECKWMTTLIYTVESYVYYRMEVKSQRV